MYLRTCLLARGVRLPNVAAECPEYFGKETSLLMHIYRSPRYNWPARCVSTDKKDFFSFTYFAYLRGFKGSFGKIKELLTNLFIFIFFIIIISPQSRFYNFFLRNLHFEREYRKHKPFVDLNFSVFKIEIVWHW